MTHCSRLKCYDDSTGTMVERYTYDPYGRTYAESWDPTANEGAGGWVANIVGGVTYSYSPICYSAFGNPFLWTGQRYDAATGLYAFLYRSYSPSLGRWLQRDPAEYVDGVNLYDYVQNDPLGWIDPLGMCDGSRGTAGAAAIARATQAFTKALDALRKARAAVQPAREAVKRGGGKAAEKALEEAEAAYEKACQGARQAAEELDTLIDPAGNTFQTEVETVKQTGKTPAELAAEAAKKPPAPGPNEAGNGTRKGDLPARGEPNSTAAKDQGGGKGQIRDYGEDGRAKRDYDFGHDHDGAGDPHAHDWDWNKPWKKRGPPRPLGPAE